MNTKWDRLSEPRLCGLLAADPSGLSKSMHNAGFRSAGLSFVYENIKTIDTELEIRRMRQEAIRGFSLTIPHKEHAVPLVDHLSAEAVAIGAINTVINDGSELHGFNTDCDGITRALEEAGYEGLGKSALVFGAGGAARAAVYALQGLNHASITICNRTDSRAEKVGDDFDIRSLPYDSLNEGTLAAYDLFINSTPIGLTLAGSDASYPFAPSDFSDEQCVFDMVTQETKLILGAEARGAKVVRGVRMLLHQAVKQFELFTESEANIQVMEAALNEAMS